ncbi:hypothetical protein ACFX19_030040 [Malus domestica]
MARQQQQVQIEVLLRKLTSVNPEDQRSAAAEIRLLAKGNADYRVAIAEAGAIPLLVGLLSTPDSRTQEHAVTALLNLSLCEDNKGSIISSGAVPGIVHVLTNGGMEARENAAAILFSLSIVDEYKVMIGASGAIPPLVTLLSEGTQGGKKDAAIALFNLCIYHGNKGKAVRAGVVSTLMKLLTEPGGGMVDEGLAILAILSSHPEGKAAIGAAEAVPVLVEVIGTGSLRNRENAAAVLVNLCSGDQQRIVEAQELGVTSSLLELVQNGTDRGKRKAAQLLELMNPFAEQQTADADADAGTSRVLWWFYYPRPRRRHFGTLADFYGPFGSISQCIFSTVQYVCFIRHAQNPIKVPLWPAIFLVCVGASRLNKNRNMIVDERRD